MCKNSYSNVPPPFHRVFTSISDQIYSPDPARNSSIVTAEIGLFDDAFDHEEWNGFQEHRDIFGSYLLLKAAVDLWQKEQFWTFQSS